MSSGVYDLELQETWDRPGVSPPCGKPPQDGTVSGSMVVHHDVAPTAFQKEAFGSSPNDGDNM